MPKDSLREMEAYAQALQEQTMTYVQLANVLDAVSAQIKKNLSLIYAQQGIPIQKAHEVARLVHSIGDLFQDDKRPRGGQADAVREYALDLALLIRALRREEETLASRYSNG